MRKKKYTEEEEAAIEVLAGRSVSFYLDILDRIMKENPIDYEEWSAAMKAVVASLEGQIKDLPLKVKK